MILRFLLLLIFLVGPFSSPALARDAANEKVFNATEMSLENGMQIVVIPNHRAPVVTHMVWYKVGAADEPLGKSGIAHFLEHLLFKGTENLAPGEFSKTIRRLGGNDNAFTGQDYTAYFQSIATEHLETVMKMEAGRMRGLAPPLEEVESERKVILEERRQRTDNNPDNKLAEQAATALFVNHPYGTPIIGWYHEMETLSWEDAKSFYDRWYGPNNAILIVAGDVEPEEVLELAKKTYGTLEPVEVPQRIRPKVPHLEAAVTVTMQHPFVKQPRISNSYRVPSYNTNEQDALALEVLSEIMGSSQTSRLYQSLVVDQKIATSAGMYYRSSALDDSTLVTYATPAENVTPETVMAALNLELVKLIEAGVTEDEVSKAIQRLQNAAIYARDSLSGPAMIIGQSLTTGSTLEQIETWPSQIATVTADQIKAVAGQYINPLTIRENPPVTSILLPEPMPEEPSRKTTQEAEQ